MGRSLDWVTRSTRVFCVPRPKRRLRRERRHSCRRLRSVQRQTKSLRLCVTLLSAPSHLATSAHLCEMPSIPPPLALRLFRDVPLEIILSPQIPDSTYAATPSPAAPAPQTSSPSPPHSPPRSSRRAPPPHSSQSPVP